MPFGARDVIRRRAFLWLAVVTSVSSCSLFAGVDFGDTHLALADGGDGTDTSVSADTGPAADGAPSDDNDATTPGADGGDANDRDGGEAGSTGDCGGKAALCTAAGGTCAADGTCHIDCPGSTCPGPRPKCPKGLKCVVTCGDDACAYGVDCNDSECTILCQGNQSCGAGDQVQCGGPTCAIVCSGQNSCKSTISCGGTLGSTMITCSGLNSCSKDVVANVDTKTSVTIACTGTNSCAGYVSTTGGGSIQCDNASCGKKVACGSGGTSCTITCDGGSCGQGACCRAGTSPCTIDPADAAVAGPCP